MTPPTPFHVQAIAGVRGEPLHFPHFAHHESVAALWNDKWREPCRRSIYPFTDGHLDDFEPIFATLIAQSVTQPGILQRPDDYARPFLPVAEALVADAERLADQGNRVVARDLFLRAAAVYRIARFPVVRSPLGKRAWQEGKAAYERAGALLEQPNIPVVIPFPDADVSAGDTKAPIPAYLRFPAGQPPEGGWPLVLFICGLDAYRTDHTPRTQAHVDRGCATLSLEIPGTGDCPAAPGDPASPDRLMTSVLDWIAEESGAWNIDSSKVVARGISTGGYYALRVAHTHASRLLAVVAQGGGAHHMFDPAWIRAQDQMEYPFCLAEGLAFKFGYRDTDPAAAIDEYAKGGHRFSLIEQGIATRPRTRLLIINGAEDSIFPIEDSVLMALAGTGTDLDVLGSRQHMGNPEAEKMIYEWIDNELSKSAKKEG